MVEDRHAAMEIVRGVLAADFSCLSEDFNRDGLLLTTPVERKGRRGFRRQNRMLGLVTLGIGTVVTCDPNREADVRAILHGFDREKIFSAEIIATLAAFVAPDGQKMTGPSLKYVCEANVLKDCAQPKDIEIAIVEGKSIEDMYRYPHFPNALGYRTDTLRPDIVATVATCGREIVGIAGASADCDQMWQIGVDVVTHQRGRGIGKGLVGRLTREVLRQGRLPYYSAAPSNIASQALACSLGYRLTWVELHARDR